MRIAMDSSVIDRFERILLNTPILTDKEEKALIEIKESGVTFCKLPNNKGDLKINPLTDSYLVKCSMKVLDIKKRVDELWDPDEDLEDCCILLAEAEEMKVDVILTTNGNFISELARKSSKVKIMKPTDYIKK